MSPIITLTFNPALDISTSVESLLPEKKLKCAEPVIEAGGGGINVARAITNLGGKAIAVYPFGGDAGRRITRLLTAASVDVKPVKVRAATRQNLIITDRATGSQYLFDMPGERLDEPAYYNCLKIICELPDWNYLVVSGSLPADYPAELFQGLAEAARNRKAKLIVDTAGLPLRQAITAGAFLIKPNLKELAFLAGSGTLKAHGAKAAAQQLLEHSNCEVIVVSMGSEGALLVTKDISMEVRPPSVSTLSTVGAGDSLVAGLVLYLAQGKSIAEAIKYGVACGTAATICPGAELCRKTDADRLFHLIV